MKNVFVLFGKPGAGKGTRLSEFLKGRESEYEVLSVGNLLRKARKEQTELGKKAESYMDAGKLVPDEIINAIIIEGIKNAEKAIFTDGYPRTLGQAQAMLENGVYPAKVINFDVADEIVIERAKDRLVCSQCGEPYTISNFKLPKKQGYCDKCDVELIRRKDDDEEVVKTRLQVYRSETEPILKYFAENNVKVYTIDSSELEPSLKRLKEIMGE